MEVVHGTQIASSGSNESGFEKATSCCPLEFRHPNIDQAWHLFSRFACQACTPKKEPGHLEVSFYGCRLPLLRLGNFSDSIAMCLLDSVIATPENQSLGSVHKNYLVMDAEDSSLHILSNV